MWHYESGLPEMKQEGLIDCVIEYISTLNGRAPPAEAKSLVEDTDGEVAHW